ncbi:MAG: L-2-amino-thiazoline-4-carboxylic acid hydrolase [Eubacteriales bacterium]|nr:L-2-amino-thiazoline-4-carboxylic acid hydrolase [Eubacteriales bacterium]
MKVKVLHKRKENELHPVRYEKQFRQWLTERYGAEEGEKLWQKTLKQFYAYLQETPTYGGIKTEKKLSICGALLVFSMASVVPEHLKAEDLEPLTQKVFMDGFVKLGKFFDLNRPKDIRLIHLVFKLVGKKRQKAFLKDRSGFCTHLEAFDRKQKATRYDFTQCPHAEFAKRHDLVHILPAMCNCDYYGIEQIHGCLVRQGTCGNSKRCDYCIVGSKNPIARNYEIVRDDSGFLISVERNCVTVTVSSVVSRKEGLLMQR